jgi:hypothetical protein
MFENEMMGLSEAGVECTAALEDVDHEGTTNRQHEKLQQCLVDLREEVGWVIPAKKTVVSTIQIPVNPEMLIEGIFPAFMQKLPQRNAQYPTGENAHLYCAEYFLSDITSVQYIATESPIDLRVCFARVASEAGSRNLDNVKKTTPMHPFWGELFDVAHSGNLVLEHSATGCDLKRSGEDNSLMILSTLCGETPGGSQKVCSRHPEYLKALQTELPEACVSLDGIVVNRERIGAMKSTPLCERQPDTGESECQRQHGLMNGQQGVPVADLGGVSEVTNVQQGLWEKSNSLFRGREDDLSKEATALKLFGHDIGGHALHFMVSAEGVLRLESVFMKSSPPEFSRSDVREWLNRVEDDFADSHRVVERANPAELPDTSWRCPLHWLQTFSNDGVYDDDARAPVPTRNQARFGHITKLNHFAHPTVLGSKKITKLRAAYFLSDGLACVGSAAECHGRTFLSNSLRSLLGKQNEWQVVDYVGSDTCARVLDWPEKDLELQGRP